MHWTKQLYFLSVMVLGYSCQPTEEQQPQAIDTESNLPLFSLLDPHTTGVHFQNRVTDQETFNILTYRNFYNGGGVAIGDINNDSLPDLYFTANQDSNKLFLNQGDFTFIDITAKAGVAGSRSWSTGVTMADVNGDGYLDIYVCNSGDVEGAGKENELFINNGDLTFTEQGGAYNLDNNGHSTHAAFFDYDMDGDLDCYILNNSFRDASKIELYRNVREEDNDPGGDKLMRNDGGTFTDATKQAGIFSSNIGFGLGVATGDLNQDNLPDIYISNDFWERDYLYLNRGNGTFDESLNDRVNYCSISSMGADIADINNDGHPEIFTTDMLPADNLRLKTTMAFDPYHLEDIKYRANFHYQMIQNCLHLNDGAANFQEIALLSGVAATDWSWGALIFDFENDGFKDLFVSNGIFRDLMSMDFRDFLADSENRRNMTDQSGNLDYRGFIQYMPSNPLRNYAFKNSDGLRFQDVAQEAGLGQPSFSNGAAYGDLDNDGDLDLVVNNINTPSFVYQNHAEARNNYLKVAFRGLDQNPFGIGAIVTLTCGNIKYTLQNFNNRGFQSSIEPLLLFGLGTADLVQDLKVTWPDGTVEVQNNIPVNQTIFLEQAQASPIEDSPEKEDRAWFEEISAEVIVGDAVHHENTYNDFDYEILLPEMLSTEGPKLVMGDVNEDGLKDFILLGAAQDPDKLFIQNTNGMFVYKAVPQFAEDRGFESTCGALFDFDGDSDLDLMLGSGGNEVDNERHHFLVRYYRNDGNGNFKGDPQNIPPVVGNFSTLEAKDFDNDGDIDVFLGARNAPGNYGLPPRSYLLVNNRGKWIDIAAPSLGNVGMVTDAQWSDLDADGYYDLIVVGDWMSIYIFKNDYGVLADPLEIPHSKGWWNSIRMADLDEDGDLDMVIGNQGLNSKFKASPQRPLTMFVNDFDNNGKSEFIINWYPPSDTLSYPFATKSELLAQLPALKKEILKYQNYAVKSYDSLFTAQQKAHAVAYETNFLESAILWNDGNFQFRLQALPLEAQVSPVYGVVVDDMDGDGTKDIWLGGNFYAMKPQAGRHDASKGVLLRGEGASFTFEKGTVTGLEISGEVRDAEMVTLDSSKVILVARNNDTLLIYRKKKD